YSKGFGHTDLVSVSDRDLADFIESRRHHWAGHPADSFKAKMAGRHS
ncbi:MAG: hypothetical protein IT536_20260, partial [Hyphomicrobiales bacterium]|nr:hypothetical protein [Hyphomicrobiales bacterium]